MRSKLIAAGLLAAAVLGGCSGGSTDQASGPKEESSQDIKQMVNDFSMRKTVAQSASITPNQLIVQDSDGKEKVYDLSNEEFFVSIAPYINNTHP